MNINEIRDNQGKYIEIVPINHPWTDQNDIDWANCD